MQALTPRVQDHQPTDVAPQTLGIRGDVSEGVRRGLQQEVVHHTFIGERQTCEGLRHREDDVDVPDGQEFLFASRHPGVPRRGQTLRAMPIAAAVVGEGRVCALLTAIAVSTECRRSALGDGEEDAPVLGGHSGAVRLQKPIAVLAHDVGHLERWRRHRRCFSRVRRAVSGAERGSASKGLATACRCFWERCRYSTVCRISAWPRSS